MIIHINTLLFYIESHTTKAWNMNKEILMNQVISVLHQSGCNVSERCNIRPRSFDIAAMCQEKLLLIKIISNVDGLKEDTALEMMYLAEYLEGSALVVAEKTRDHPLESSVVYYRYGVPSINIDTLFDYLIEDLPPVIYAAPGGLYVNIDGSVLREVRIKSNLSIGALAAQLGVSRRAISKYEEEGMDMSVDIVIHLEEMFNQALALAIDFLNVEKTTIHPRVTPPETESGFNIKCILSSLGLDVISISQAPFNAVSFKCKDNNERSTPTILTGYSDYSGAMIKRAKLMSSISEVSNTHSMFIVNGTCKSERVDNTVLMEKNEIEAMDDFKELLRCILEKGPNN